MHVLKSIAAPAALLAALGTGSFAATFDGTTIRATTSFPTLPGSTTSGPFDRVIDGSVEFPTALFAPFYGPTFDFAGDTITISHQASGHATAVFNGWIFNDLNDALADFTGFSVLSDSSGFFAAAPGRLSFDAENLMINFQGLSFTTPDEQIVLRVDFDDVSSVPLPAGLPLLLGALGWLAYTRRRA